MLEIWVTYLNFQGHAKLNTVTPVFKTTWEIGTTWELKTATSVPRSIHYIEMDLRNKTTSEFRTVFDSPLGVPKSQVSLYDFLLVLNSNIGLIRPVCEL